MWTWIFPEWLCPSGMSADDGRMTGEVFFAEFQAKCLCLFHGQAVVGCIAWVEADDILVAFDITMLGVLTILAVCQQTGRCKREIAALKGVEQVQIPQLRLALFIQKLLPGERIVLVNEVRFDGGVVRVFRGCICLSVAIQFTQNFLGVAAEMQSGLQVRQGVSLVSARCLHRRS